jgi:hypothetical protein
MKLSDSLSGGIRAFRPWGGAQLEDNDPPRRSATAVVARHPSQGDFQKTEDFRALMLTLLGWTFLRFCHSFRFSEVGKN